MNENCRAPIVALTANAVSGMKEMFLEKGMDDYLAKPIDSQKLFSIIDKWIPRTKRRKDLNVQKEKGETKEEVVAQLRKELGQVPGMDIAMAISLLGNKETFVATLRQFYKELDKYARNLLDDMAEENWKDFSIKAHAVKGIFATIGAMPLSSKAYELEQASKEGNYTKCLKETDDFCEALLEFQDALSRISVNTELDNVPVEKEHVELETVSSLLTELSKVCRLGMCDATDEYVEQLKKISYSEEIDVKLEEIVELVADFDYDSAAQKCEDLEAVLK
jgi:CheY-like chemotaxis protein